MSHDERLRLGGVGAERFDHLLARLEAGLQTLDDKPEETSETTLRALWLCAAGQAVSAQAALGVRLPALNGEQDGLLRSLIEQRLLGTPLAHLTGRQRFMGVDLLAGPGALIPRRETELLARTAIALLAEASAARGRGMALDICTGSGNLAVAMAVNVPASRVMAADLSMEAVELARRNIEHLSLQQRVEVRQGDLLAPFDAPEFLGQVDVLVCNPPYISSGKVGSMPTEISEHEPSLAFDGGPFGVRIIQRLMQDAPRFLRPGGWIAFEVGLGQGRSVVQRMGASRRYVDIQPLTDDRGDIRAVMGRSAGS